MVSLSGRQKDVDTTMVYTHVLKRVGRGVGDFFLGRP